MKAVEKLNGSIDSNLMKNTKIVCIGIGGSNQLCESLVRSNLGSLVCIDFDNIDETNIVSQGYYQNEVGMPKVLALGDRLRKVNPEINYNGLNSDILCLSERELDRLFANTDLLLVMTDNFHAQAKGNLIALKYNIPAVFATMYEKARCSEVFFWIPGVTPGCFRCAVSSRYKAYYEEHYVNNIQAQAFTILHVQYLNSIIGLITLAIIHRNFVNLELGNWFGDNWDKNFVQIRMHPRYSMNKENLFYRTFNNHQAIFTFDTIWQKIEKECPPNYNYYCPDCSNV